MKILITGSHGFIGTTVCQKLQYDGHEVYGLDNLSLGSTGISSIPEPRFFQNDIRNRKEIDFVLREAMPEVVIHLAAIHYIPYCNQYPIETAEVNIMGTRNVLDACEEARSVRRIVYASTAAVYPDHPVAISEELRPGPMDIYGVTKLIGEDLCSLSYLRSKKSTTILRFFNAFGPHETNPHLLPTIMDQLCKGERTISLGNLAPKRDYIHVTDMANAIAMLLERDAPGLEVFNLGSGIEYSVLDVIECFEQTLGEKIHVHQDAMRARRVDRLHLLASTRKLEEATGWQPKMGLKEGIESLLMPSPIMR